MSPPVAEPGALPPDNYLSEGRTLWSWLTTRDHKRIGVMFLMLTLGFFFLGGVFALALRIELLTPGRTIMGHLAYNRSFTLHGVIMVWLFMIPAIPSAFGNFLVPLMIGARDVAFPRLNLASVYLFLLGASVALWGMIQGGADTGWTFYTPYSTTTGTAVLPVLLGVFIIGFSTILTGLNFIATVHLLRAPGLTWMRLPLFVWAIYGTSIIQVLATPVLGMVLLLVALERVVGAGIFDPARGGDPILFQHLFWFYSHPAVYIMVLPSMGVISEAVCAFSRKNAFSYRMIVYSTMGIAFVGFFTWGHHMFTSGESTFGAGAFGVMSMLVAIFTAIKIFSWLGTLYRGSIALEAPLFYVLGFMFFLFSGGMIGVAYATTSLNLHWHDTYSVVAHFHFIMVGATLMAFLAGLHYWFPKMFGRTYPGALANAAAVLVVFGFIATFVPQFLLGNAGMPRRYADYPPRFQSLHVASTAGASLLAFGFLSIAGYLAWSLRHGALAGDNPWGSLGFEWQSQSPPPTRNFDVTPVHATGPHQYAPGEPRHAA
ncbi:cytochrome c oxidase subunit I [Corallococcus sp. H22C18031201]|uniref:cbb3-type cytochrome c oxidase subunit I n=1 Tax=Citreicoccus inhibens TaxID=2849499 RepID=UPI000E7397DF|nr:cbb3-type cytochrome c oxidase subunit I [Citreicoccus inhibens]MBU8897292.1 cbb3-type cytochrome c oxidase subunit I [Citreicoccus inhibens]RJS21148.1 cytochrome c oxidase subunit I [Corallococcus sp. H22C18031201]